MTEWTVVHNGDVGRFEASFPENTPDRPTTPYVRIRSRTSRNKFQSSILRVKLRRGADQNQVWISGRNLKGVADNSQIDVETNITASQFKWYVLTRSSEQRYALAGLAMAVIGTLLDLSLKIGDNHPHLSVGDTGVVLTEVASAGLKILGFTLIFVKGLWSVKESD